MLTSRFTLTKEEEEFETEYRDNFGRIGSDDLEESLLNPLSSQKASRKGQKNIVPPALAGTEITPKIVEKIRGSQNKTANQEQKW